MLSMWRPPSYLSGCSQAVWTRGEPVARAQLRLLAATASRARSSARRWTGRRVIGMSDCLWGLLDGVNDAGLAVSLAFGGRRVVGRGSACRSSSATCCGSCETVARGRQRARRLPYHLAHTLTLVDRSGAFVTAYLSPDRGAVFRESASRRTTRATSSGTSMHARPGRSSASACIAAALDEAADPRSSPPRSSVRRCSRPTYASGMGTLYTAIYKPVSGSVGVPLARPAVGALVRPIPGGQPHRSACRSRSRPDGSARSGTSSGSPSRCRRTR